MGCPLLRRQMDGRVAGASGAVRMRPRGPAWAAEVGIGAVGLMHPLSLLVGVESAGVILVLLVARTGTGTETVMEVDLGMGEIDDRRCLGENRHLHGPRGVTGTVRRGIGGRHLVLVLGLDRVHLRGGEGRRRRWLDCFEKCFVFSCEL